MGRSFLKGRFHALTVPGGDLRPRGYEGILHPAQLDVIRRLLGLVLGQDPQDGIGLRPQLLNVFLDIGGKLRRFVVKARSNLEDLPFEVVIERLDHVLDLDRGLIETGLVVVIDRRDRLRPPLLVQFGDDERGEIDDLFQVPGRNVQQLAEPTGRALHVPDVRHRGGEFHVAHALAPYPRPRDLDAALVADDPLVGDALVLTAGALPILRRTERPLAEKTITLGLERAVVNRLRFQHLAV